MNSATGLRRLWTLALVASALLGTGCFGELADEADDTSEQPLNVDQEELPRSVRRELTPGTLQAGPFPNPWSPCAYDPGAGAAIPPPCVILVPSADNLGAIRPVAR